MKILGWFRSEKPQPQPQPELSFETVSRSDTLKEMYRKVCDAAGLEAHLNSTPPSSFEGDQLASAWVCPAGVNLPILLTLDPGRRLAILTCGERMRQMTILVGDMSSGDQWTLQQFVKELQLPIGPSCETY